TRRIPTLVQYCQRVAAIHVDAISSFGKELRYDLIQPILDRCTVDQLLRLEHDCPIPSSANTTEIWKNLCFQAYPLVARQHSRKHLPEPESWKDHYFVLVEEEAQQIDKAGIKIRQQRQEAESRKKAHQVKLTTQLPPAPKKRRCELPIPPKTLLQKTRLEAAQIHRTILG
ncbi:RNA polymerase II transcription factor SIII subunit A-domain-containing protein, partial [Mycena filopes]